MAANLTHFKQQSPTHLILMYASSKRSEYITINEIFSMFSHKLRKPSDAIRSLEVLTRHGYVCKVLGGWKITQLGLEHLRKIAKPETGYFND